MMILENSITKLGEGTVVTLDSGEVVFKLASFENNPMIKPQDIENLSGRPFVNQLTA